MLISRGQEMSNNCVAKVTAAQLTRPSVVIKA